MHAPLHNHQENLCYLAIFPMHFCTWCSQHMPQQPVLPTSPYTLRYSYCATAVMQRVGAGSLTRLPSNYPESSYCTSIKFVISESGAEDRPCSPDIEQLSEDGGFEDWPLGMSFHLQNLGCFSPVKASCHSHACSMYWWSSISMLIAGSTEVEVEEMQCYGLYW